METSLQISSSTSCYGRESPVRSAVTPITLPDTLRQILNNLELPQLIHCSLVNRIWNINSYYLIKKKLLAASIERVMKLFVMTFVSTQNRYPSLEAEGVIKEEKKIGSLLSELNKNSKSSAPSRYPENKNSISVNIFKYCQTLIRQIEKGFKAFNYDTLLQVFNKFLETQTQSNSEELEKKNNLVKFKIELVNALKENKDISLLFKRINEFLDLEVSEELTIIQKILNTLQDQAEYSPDDFKCVQRIKIMEILNKTYRSSLSVCRIHMHNPLAENQYMGSLLTARDGREMALVFPLGFDYIAKLLGGVGKFRTEAALISLQDQNYEKLVPDGIVRGNQPPQFTPNYLSFFLELTHTNVQIEGRYYIRFTWENMENKKKEFIVESNPFTAKMPKPKLARLEEVFDSDDENSMHTSGSQGGKKTRYK